MSQPCRGDARSGQRSIREFREGVSTQTSPSFRVGLPPDSRTLNYKTYNKKAASTAASHRSFCCRSFNDYYSLIFIEIGEHHFYDFALFRWHQFTDVVRLNRKFTMFVPAIDQHRKLHPPRTPEIDQLIHCRADRAAGVKHVVNPNDRASFNVTRQFGAADDGLRADS